MSTITTQESFLNSLAEIAAKDRRRQRTALTMTVAMTVVATIWLGISALQVRRLEKQSSDLRDANRIIETQIRTGNEFLAALVPLLKNFGWAGDKLPKDLSDIERIKRSVEADNQLLLVQIESPSYHVRNAAIQYYPKDVDGTKVETALRQFGFSFSERPPLVPDVPADDVVFGDAVSPNSAKIVAYVLIRAGVDIKGIHRSNLQAKKSMIQVIANRIVADGKPLSPDAIAQMTSFDPDPTW